MLGMEVFAACLCLLLICPSFVLSASVKRGEEVSFCDFETDLCGYTQDTRDDFDWTRRSGETPSSNTGPTTDHTLLNSEGSYMYIEVSGKDDRSKANLIKLLPGTANTDVDKRDCTYTFWYHMYGSHVGTLNIMVSDTLKWTKSENQGDEWHEGSFTLSVSASQDTSIVIEGIRGQSFRGDIAIDDLELICVSDVGSEGDGCTSDTDACHEHAACNDTPEWSTCQCNEGYTGDGVDTCTDKNECEEMTDNCDDHATCINTPGSFTCQCNGGYSGDGVSCADVDECLAGSHSCHMHATCTNAPGSFTCTCNDGFEGDGNSCEDVDECTTASNNCHERASCANTAGSFTCACIAGYDGDGISCSNISDGQDELACGFETDLCGYVQDTEDEFDWTKGSGDTPSSSTGPTNDHTHKNSDGSYMFIETSGITEGFRASLKRWAPASDSPRDCTFRFWYHMYGTDIGTLNVLASNEVKWTKSGDQGNEWHEGSFIFTLPASGVGVKIEGVRGSGFRGDIAIDDLLLECEKVENENECTSGTNDCHEHATCIDTPERFTCQCKEGYSGDGTSCTDTNECLAGSHSCHVHATCTNAPGSFTCICNDGFDGDGNSCEDVDECMTASHNCHEHASCANTAGSFTCECIAGYDGDGISCSSINDGPDELACGFETDLCGYVQDPDDDFDWTKGSGDTPSSSTGPTTDHTHKNSDGSYMFIETSGITEGFRAGLKRLVPASDSPRDCTYRFWYHMHGTDIGTLNVMTADEVKWTQSGDQGNEWHEGSFIFTLPASGVEVEIEGVRGSGFRGDIAIDDLLLECEKVENENECTSGTNDCHEHATCIDTPERFTCQCKEGYSGDGTSCTDINDCDLNPCHNGGSCIDGVNSYSCQCMEGWEGDTCQNDVDECTTASHNCHEHASCANTAGRFMCNCIAGYDGDGISCSSINDACQADEFQCNDGTCIPKSFRCDRFTDCSENEDELCCNSNDFPCSNGQCIDPSLVCDGVSDCNDGGDEVDCPGTKACQADEFQCNDGTCIPKSFRCDRFTDCSENEDELCCNSNDFPCSNGQCIDPSLVCDGVSDCNDGGDEADCPGTKGCEINEFTCGDGSCIPLAYRCDRVSDCDDDEDNCEDIDECLSSPCIHGNCVDGSNMYSCICDPGWTGSNCQIDIDECYSSPCIHGNCVDGINRYSCVCDPGWTSSNCQINIDECLSSPCIHGNCVDGSNMYSCVCDPGWTGSKCQIDIDECYSSPCIHGNCVDGINRYSCICDPGWTGSNCQIDINECTSSPCRNEGSCIDGVNLFTCRCIAEWTGDLCQTETKTVEDMDMCRFSDGLCGYIQSPRDDLNWQVLESKAVYLDLSNRGYDSKKEARMFKTIPSRNSRQIVLCHVQFIYSMYSTRTSRDRFPGRLNMYVTKDGKRTDIWTRADDHELDADGRYGKYHGIASFTWDQITDLQIGYSAEIEAPGNGKIYLYEAGMPVCVPPTEPVYKPDMFDTGICGTRPAYSTSSRIVGGREADPGAWPWQVYMNGHTKGCGASLVNREWAITAAHCIDTSLTIIFGDTSKSSRSISQFRQESTATAFCHPSYGHMNRHDNDICLLRLDTPIQFTDYVRPICLSTSQSENHDYESGSCYSTGWGRLEYEGESPDDLQELQTDITHDCWDLPPESKKLITNNMYCIEGENGGDTCQGDSGGPHACRNSNGSWHLVGATSWGPPCATGYPGVNAKISPYLDWIYTTVKFYSKSLLDHGVN